MSLGKFYIGSYKKSSKTFGIEFWSDSYSSDTKSVRYGMTLSLIKIAFVISYDRQTNNKENLCII